MPRGPSLGHVRNPKLRFGSDTNCHHFKCFFILFNVSCQVSMLPENDRWSETRSQLLAQMDVSMGGRVAEEIIFGHDYITTGKKKSL